MPGPRTPPPLHLRQLGAAKSAVVRHERLLYRLQGLPPAVCYRKGYLAAYGNATYRRRTLVTRARARLAAGDPAERVLCALLEALW
jgi:hypothetical protein